MKKMISSFGSAVLSREQMKGVKGGIMSDEDPGEEGTCTKKCSIKGDCAGHASGRGCECSTHDGGTC